jgi:Animal haem peroxidase
MTPSPTETKPSRHFTTPSPTQTRPPPGRTKPSLLDRAIVKVFKGVNKVVSWDKLPRVIGIFNLLALRIELRAKNLFDVYPSQEYQGTKEADPLPDPRYLKARDTDGRFNSLEQPLMGSVCMRFGRNVPREYTAAPTEDELLTPNPRVISDRLLARRDGQFKPATIINLLAAAWVQFQVHDWVTHYQVRPYPLLTRTGLPLVHRRCEMQLLYRCTNEPLLRVTNK